MKRVPVMSHCWNSAAVRSAVSKSTSLSEQLINGVLRSLVP